MSRYILLSLLVVHIAYGLNIVIDPGHGLWWPGTMGYENRGPAEKWRNLEIGLKLRGSLEDYPDIFTVYMTRDRDTALVGGPDGSDSLIADLRRRAWVANGTWPAAGGVYVPYPGADVFISIHLNAYADPSIDGQEALYCYNSELAAKIVDNLYCNIDGYWVETDSCDDFVYLAYNRGYIYDCPIVLSEVNSNIPATLVEVLFYTNQEGWCAMWNDGFKATAACGLFYGIIDYFGWSGALTCNPTGICEDYVPPWDTLVSPNGGEEFYAGGTCEITWVAGDSSEPGSQGITLQRLYYSPDNGNSWELIDELDGDTRSYTWHIPCDLATSECKVKVVVYDCAGHTATDASDGTFIVHGVASPTNLTAEVISEDEIALQWQDNIGEGARFLI